MKLYGTIISERARKGQGGNKDILMVLTAEIANERQEIASIAVINSDKGFYAMDVKLADGKFIHQKISKGETLLQKVKKEKGERCVHGDPIEECQRPHK